MGAVIYHVDMVKKLPQFTEIYSLKHLLWMYPLHWPFFVVLFCYVFEGGTIPLFSCFVVFFSFFLLFMSLFLYP